METGGGRYDIVEGTNVYGSDGDKVGSVVQVGPNYVVVEKGFFFPTDYYIPMGAIASTGDDGVYLNVTKDAALNQGWDVAPPADDASVTYADDAATSVGTETIGTYATDNSLAASGAATSGVIGSTFDAADATRIAEGDDTIVVPVVEEELTAVRREREAGAVRVEKDVVAEERVLEVPVTEERVRVERRAVDRPVDAADADAAFEEGVIEVPVRSEEVELRKRARVAEEVVVDKEAVQRTEQVAGTVRREEVRVEDATTDAGATDATIADATIADAGRPRTSDTNRAM